MVAVLLALCAAPAWGQSQRIQDELVTMHRDAMARYDGFEFEEARALLEAAIARADEQGLAWSPFLARVHLDLGVVFFSGLQDRTAAELQFIKAVEIDPQIELDPAYSAKEMEALLQAVKRRHGKGEVGQDEVRAAPVDCNAVAGIEHALVESAEAGVDRWIEAFVSERLGAARVVLHYRPYAPPGQGGDDPASGAASSSSSSGGASADYIAIEMEKQDTCKWVARIPGHGIRGTVVHYFIAAHNKSGGIIASRGSSNAPNLMLVASDSGGDGENPLAPHAPARAARPGHAGPRWLLGLGLGTGGGYISGSTEQTGTPIECCFAPELLHLRAELGYRVAPRTSLSLVLRLGIPLGANIDQHASTAPGGLLRLRHALGESDRQGLVLSAVLGGGVVRQTIRIDNGGNGMDTDTAAIGPILAGGGASYVHPLGERLGLVAGGEMLVGLPVVETIGSTKPQFGVQLDLDVGVVFAF